MSEERALIHGVDTGFHVLRNVNRITTDPNERYERSMDRYICDRCRWFFEHSFDGSFPPGCGPWEELSKILVDHARLCREFNRT